MRTELHDAAEKGDVKRIRELVAQGFSVHEDDGSIVGGTPLHYAARNEHLNVIRYFIKECGADPNSISKYRHTPLQDAIIAGKVNAVDCLINEFHVNPNNSDKYGRSSLTLAAWIGEVDIVRCLINKFHVDPNSIDEYGGNTPLHTAAESSCLAGIELITCLAELGSDLYAKNKFGQTPLDVANTEEKKKLLQKLMKEQIKKTLDNKEYEKAIALCTQALELTPSEAEFYYNKRASAEYNLEKYEAALKDWRKAIRLNPQPAFYYYGLGCSLFEFKRYDEALSNLQKAIELKPNAKWISDAKHCQQDASQLLEQKIPTEKKKPRKLKKKRSTKTETNNFSYTKPLPIPPKRTSKPSQTKTTAEIQTELKKELAITPQQSLEKALLIAPKELVEDASTKLKEKEEQLAQVLAEKRALEKQIEVLKQDQQTNASEIKRLETKIVTIEETLTLLEPITSLQRAKNDSIALFAQNPNALEFYNTTHTFLKAFFDGICGAYNPVVSKKANGSLNTIAGVIEKISGWISFLPFANTVCNFLSGQLNDQSLKIIKNRIKWLTHLSKQPELPLLIEKIARELTIRHEDDITQIDNTQNTPSKLKQIKDEFYKEGEFSSVQNLAEYAVSMMIGDMLEGKNVSTANLQDRCLAAVLKVSSGLGFVTKKIDAFFSKSVVRIKVNNQSITTTENCHYGDFFSHSINQNNNVTLSIPTPSNKIKVTPQVTTFTPVVPNSDETIKKVDHLEQTFSTFQQKHEELSRSYSHIKYQLEKTTVAVSKLEKGKSKTSATEIDCGEQMQMQEIPLVNPAEVQQGLFSNSNKVIELQERNQELEKDVTGLKEEQKILQDKISLLEEKVKETNHCVPKGCSII